MKITRKELVIVALAILLLVNSFYRTEHFKDSLDDVDAMDKKMEEISDLEKETRMFCKLLRHDEDRVQMQDLLNSRNQQFQDNWKKQNKLIGDIKKKFIKLRLEKDGQNFMEFNDNRNDKTEEMKKRKQLVEKAKEIAESPYKLNLNINNNSN